MLELKACPRCKGAINVNRDMYGSYRQCLHCGYMKDVASPNRLLESLALAPVKKKVA